MPTDREREINRLASARYRANHPERRSAILRKYRHSEQGSRKQREYQWQKRIGKLYSIDQATYDRMLQEQEGKCYLCGQPETAKHKNGEVMRLCVDHSHTTGRVRRLLCHGCNFLVGRMETRPALHEKALAYIRQFGE